MTKINFEDFLAQHGTLLYTNTGGSMLPLLKEGRDVMIISQKPANRLTINDVPLYKRDSGEYVLHRIIQVKPNYYLIRGDNTYYIEKVTENQIIGVLTGIIRDGRTISVTDKDYLNYVKKRNRSYPLRYLRQVFSRIKRRIFI